MSNSPKPTKPDAAGCRCFHGCVRPVSCQHDAINTHLSDSVRCVCMKEREPGRDRESISKSKAVRLVAVLHVAAVPAAVKLNKLLLLFTLCHSSDTHTHTHTSISLIQGDRQTRCVSVCLFLHLHTFVCVCVCVCVCMCVCGRQSPCRSAAHGCMNKHDCLSTSTPSSTALCFILFCSVLFCSVLFHSILFCCEIYKCSSSSRHVDNSLHLHSFDISLL